jgi:hypothetical protein
MMRQDQRVEEGSEAFQAGRDIIVQRQMSAEQMAEIMLAMAKQLSMYQADAMRTVEERLASFRKEVLRAFTESGRANPEAFRDPDFQYLLNEAQVEFARSGDEAVRDTLIDIISRRSLEPERNRMVVTLNDAAIRAPRLTRNEFAALSLCYIARYTVNHGINSFDDLCAYVRSYLSPFVPDIARENASFWHLEAQGCASVEMGELRLGDLLRKRYTGALGKGFDRQTLEAHLPDGMKSALDELLMPSLHDPDRLQPAAINRDVFHAKAAGSALAKPQLDNVWNAFENTVPPEPDLISLLAPTVPGVDELFRVWEDTPLKNLKLNSVGIAIGHANAVRVINFDAPLSIWIK